MEHPPIPEPLTDETLEDPEPSEPPEPPEDTIPIKEPAAPHKSHSKTLFFSTAAILLLFIITVSIFRCGDGDIKFAGGTSDGMEDVDTDEDRVLVPQMVYVNRGSFWMGSNDWEMDEEEDRMPHEVRLFSFWIGKYEVSQKEWNSLMPENPSNWKGDNLPVENVSWLDAVEYCNRLSEFEGLTPCYSGSGEYITCNWNADGYRLPTEAEWEFAARGGVKSNHYTYSGSDYIHEVAWFDENSGARTKEVGTKEGNELGIHDMSGNVWEWCWDWYDEHYYWHSPYNNPRGAGDGIYRCLRGGSWFYNASLCYVAMRSYRRPVYRYSNAGFRVCRKAD